MKKFVIDISSSKSELQTIERYHDLIFPESLKTTRKFEYTLETVAIKSEEYHRLQYVLKQRFGIQPCSD